MRTIGVLGGMTWHSSSEYYRLLNTAVNERLGGVHSARCVLFSVDMGPIADLMAADRWEEAGRQLALAARSVEASGADLFVLATNSLHNVWDIIVADLTIPALHIGDATGSALVRDGHTSVALLGTRYPMELPFSERPTRGELRHPRPGARQHDRESLHRAVFEELAVGLFTDETRNAFVEVIRKLGARGATAVVLGCTEFGLLLRDGDVELPLYDTAHLHAAAAVDAALSD